MATSDLGLGAAVVGVIGLALFDKRGRINRDGRRAKSLSGVGRPSNGIASNELRAPYGGDTSGVTSPDMTPRREPEISSGINQSKVRGNPAAIISRIGIFIARLGNERSDIFRPNLHGIIDTTEAIRWVR